jgi:hypothetical protein
MAGGKFTEVNPPPREERGRKRELFNEQQTFVKLNDSVSTIILHVVEVFKAIICGYVIGGVIFRGFFPMNVFREVVL